MELLMSKYRDAYNQRTEGLANAIKQIEELKKENFKLHNKAIIDSAKYVTAVADLQCCGNCSGVDDCEYIIDDPETTAGYCCGKWRSDSISKQDRLTRPYDLIPDFINEATK